MRITCSCGKKLQVNDALAGKRVKCPGCGEAILAREDGVQECAKAAPARPPRPAFSEEEDEDRPRRPRLRDEDEDADRDSERPQAKGVSVLGIISLVLGILGAAISLFPCIGMFVGGPLAGIGLILGVIGLIVAMKGKQSGMGLPIAGTAVSLLGLIIAGVWLGISTLWVRQASQQVQQMQSQVQQEMAKVEQEQARVEQEKQQIRQGPAIDVTAAALAKEYDANGIAADQKYKGKVLAVKGRVDRVDDFGFKATLRLKTDGVGQTVDCEFEADQKHGLAGLRPGSQVTVRGKCKGKFGFSPGLEKCVLAR